MGRRRLVERTLFLVSQLPEVLAGLVGFGCLILFAIRIAQLHNAVEHFASRFLVLLMGLFEGFHGFSRVEFVVGALDVAFQRVAARTTVRLDRLVVLVSLIRATLPSALAETRGVPLLAAHVACDVREVLFDVTVLCLVACWPAWTELRAPLTPKSS